MTTKPESPDSGASVESPDVRFALAALTHCIEHGRRITTAEAMLIRKVINTRESAGDQAVAWEFQHEETGLMTTLSNDGINNPENFVKNNPRLQYVGPLYRHPYTRAQDAAGKGVEGAPDLHVAICQAVALMNRTPSREQTFHEAHTILRQALMDYNPAKPAQVGQKYRAVGEAEAREVHRIIMDAIRDSNMVPVFTCYLALNSIGAVVPAQDGDK